MEDCIFCKIARGDVVKKFTYEDESIMVFPDIHPQKPVHLLIIPKKHLTDFLAVSDDHTQVLLFTTTQDMIRQFRLENLSYKIVINKGDRHIKHLHLHLIGSMSRSQIMPKN